MSPSKSCRHEGAEKEGRDVDFIRLIFSAPKGPPGRKRRLKGRLIVGRITAPML